MSKVTKALQNKAKKTGKSVSTLRKIYNRGLAAHRTSGHRTGASPHAWAMARVNSATTGGKAAKVDSDILKGKKSKNRNPDGTKKKTKKKGKK
mgnify:FL=1|tara:strand:- start:790 stop:1068 length:279 start_codon:yes stop_codon:yes gene_type:complete